MQAETIFLKFMLALWMVHFSKNQEIQKKIGGVGPVDNRPFID